MQRLSSRELRDWLGTRGLSCAALACAVSHRAAGPDVDPALASMLTALDMVTASGGGCLGVPTEEAVDAVFLGLTGAILLAFDEAPPLASPASVRAIAILAEAAAVATDILEAHLGDLPASVSACRDLVQEAARKADIAIASMEAGIPASEREHAAFAHMLGAVMRHAEAPFREARQQEPHGRTKSHVSRDSLC